MDPTPAPPSKIIAPPIVTNGFSQLVDDTGETSIKFVTDVASVSNAGLPDDFPYAKAEPRTEGQCLAAQEKRRRIRAKRDRKRAQRGPQHRR